MRKLLLGVALFHAATAFAQAPDLAARLREGGYVVYLRHASTDFGQNDAEMTTYADCSKQRNLTDQGRDDARALGEHFRHLGIPVTRVLASPFCRTMETAQIAFGKAQPMRDINGRPPPMEDAKGLRRLLGMPLAPGENLVISSHGMPFHAVAGPPHLLEGEIAVVRPMGDSRFAVVGRIRLEDWQALK